MTAQDYIYSTLEALERGLPTESIGAMSLEEAIFAKVMSKKFRKLRADENTVRIAKNAVHWAVSRGEPVTVSYLFGGNKLWRFDEAPEIDWAEFFAVTYFLRWMKSIASVYPPGARLDFYSEDIAVETLNNIPRAEAEQYSETFRAMLEWLRPHVPGNVQITYRRYAEEYADYSDYLRELEDAKALYLKQHDGKLPNLSDAQKAATELNVRLLPGQDDDLLWREKVELTHKCLEETETLKRYLNDPSLVMACPTLYSGWIATGSTKKSYAKFWAGVGVLGKAGEGFDELVLTPKQLAAARFDWQNVHIAGLPGKNFSRIRVLG